MSQLLSYSEAVSTPWKTLKRLAVFGVFVIGVFILGLGTWSAEAPLTSAALASGTVVVETHRKTIQHLEGGIVSAILVKEGDVVTKNEPLMRLEDVKARTTLTGLEGQLWEALATEARLTAERRGVDWFDDPPELEARKADPDIARILLAQRQLFLARTHLMNSKVRLIDENVHGIETEITGLKDQKAIATRQKGYIQEELDMVQALAAKGLDRRPRVLQLEGTLAEADGKIATSVAQIGRAKQNITEAQMNLVNLKNQNLKEIADELRTVHGQIHEIREKVQEACDVMTRTVVRAPEAGIVTELRVHTLGGVINAGDPLLDLVPAQDRTLIEAKIRPDDIDVVRPGLQAQVRLSPYQQRRTRPLDGKVTYVSADRLIDKASNQPYYLARISIDEAQLKARSDVEMRPGMPGEVTIQTGLTTVALYALSPLLDSFRRAGIEN